MYRGCQVRALRGIGGLFGGGGPRQPRMNRAQKEQMKQIEQRNVKLEEIAWEQSHMVRAPLAKIMGLIELLKISEKQDF